MSGVKHTPVHPDNTAWRAVDACGGIYTPAEEASGFAAGHRAALASAMVAVGHADGITAALLEALETLDASWLADFPAGPDGDYSDRFVSPAEEHVVIWRKIRTAITRATGDRPEKGGAL